MAKYYLGERAARAVRQLMHGSSSVGTVPGAIGEPVDVQEFAAPYTVQWAQSLDNGDGAWIIWLPVDSLLDMSGRRLNVAQDLEAAGGGYVAGWYKLTSAMIDPSSGGTLYLNVKRTKTEGSEEEITAVFSAEDGYDEDQSSAPGETSGEGEESAVVASITICKATVSDTGASRSVKQFVSSVIMIGSGSAADPDNASLDTDDTGKYELYHFKDAEQDSGKGLAKRLKADPETGEITSDDNTGVMLVARKNGKVIYIPLSGDGEDPEDPVTPGGEQCDHDKTGGKEGGVAPSKESEPGGGPSGGVPAGGVPAGGGERHIGDDGCNCE